MRRYRKSLIGLSLFTVLAVAMTWMVYATLQREIAGPTKTYTATFTDVLGMAPGDDVRVAGVRVGRVDRIDLDEPTAPGETPMATVTFRVLADQVLYSNTLASVTYQNVIGQRYLGLSAGADEAGPPTVLPDRGNIPVANTNPSFDISYMFNGFEPLFTELDPEQVDNLTDALIQAFQGDSTSVLVLTTQASMLAETLAGPDQVLGDLIGNLNLLMTSLAEQNTQLQTMIEQSRQVMAELSGRRDELVSSVGSINATVGRLATIVDAITPNVQEFIARKPGFLDYGLHDGRERFAYMAANLPLLLKGISRIFQEGAYLSGYPCDIDFTLWRGLFFWFRAFVAAATPGDDTEALHTPMCR
ncbi:MCE family protein [Mycobacterium koreense]|uniref:Mammalian cell entry protein n=1 Tax=Mycolicibacillus koreensis TaxID=1069220 RepID=A0A7I7SFI9_9MYCO|nr:MlaD family protein [Mycolicibacillus koreensis]MCV7248332.1 MCE family protein [Mycolicibacillus koreensis]OSC33741.1 mammalian cell entry protein [Mycolicibacillus koreensis]BBY55270.1 putative Mce family protein [Mycolicibacillus koreensis]